MSLIIGISMSKTLYLLAGGLILIVIALAGAIFVSRFGAEVPRFGDE